jgi:hypothetical protein
MNNAWSDSFPIIIITFIGLVLWIIFKDED